MLKFLKNLCVELDIVSWLDAQDNKYDTIEELFTAFNTEKPFAGKAIEYCLCGKEYLNKGGYINYELLIMGERSFRCCVCFSCCRVCVCVCVINISQS